MKTDIHPPYFKEATITCSCGNVMVTGSTIEAYTTELCSKCHPFYTGKKKTVDTAGRIEKFEAKRKKAETMKGELEKKDKKRRKSMEDKVNEAIKKELELEKKREAALQAKLKKGSAA